MNQSLHDRKGLAECSLVGYDPEVDEADSPVEVITTREETRSKQAVSDRRSHTSTAYARQLMICL